MADVSLVATKSRRYGKKWLTAGKVFTVRRSEVALLKALGWARDAEPAQPVDVPAPVVKPTRKPRTSTKSEPAPEPVPEPVSDPTPVVAAQEPQSAVVSTDSAQDAEPRSNRWYKRRDMTAESE